jgi:hypothetical protein
VYYWGLPLGCLFLAVAAATGIVALQCLDGIAMRAGVGVAALLAYAAVMCVHYFERSPCPLHQGSAENPKDGGNPNLDERLPAMPCGMRSDSRKW